MEKRFNNFTYWQINNLDILLLDTPRVEISIELDSRLEIIFLKFEKFPISKLASIDIHSCQTVVKSLFNRCLALKFPKILLNNSIFVYRSCNILSSLTISTEIVCNTALYYLILHLIIALDNSNSYLSLYSSNLFVFDFLIIIIIVEVSFIDVNIIYRINFSIALLILFGLFIEFLFIYSST